MGKKRYIEKRGTRGNKRNSGSLTVEASIVLVMFLIAYMAILSIINMYRAQVLIQNAANQTAAEIAQYTYILQKAGMADFGEGSKKSSKLFQEDTERTIGTMFTFFEATSNGLDAAKSTVGSVTQQSIPTSIYEWSESLQEIQNETKDLEGKLENIGSSAQAMMDAGKEYFKDPQAILNGLLAILKDLSCDSVKIAVAAPITNFLMNKYLAAYPEDHLEKLGVIDGIAGINYWGSSILVDMQSIEVVASYKMKIELPFLDKFQYNMKTTASTRAWLGDGTHNDNNRGTKLDSQALGTPGSAEEESAGVIIEGTQMHESFFKLNTTVDQIVLPDGTWDKPALERGTIVGEFLGNNVGSNYPVIDKYEEATGTATSIKSRDLTTSSYQKEATLLRTIKTDIDKLASFEPVSWGSSDLEGKPVNQRVLQMIVPNTELSTKQIQAINDAIKYATDNNVKLVITVGL